MIRRALLALAFFASSAFAAPVSFQLNDIRLVDFVRLVYSEVLQKSYVLDSDILANQDVVTVHLRNIDSAELERKLNAMLKARGFGSVGGSGVVVVGKIDDKEEQKHTFVYRPQYRSVSYLLDLVQSLFPQGAFSGQRGISSSMQPGQQVQQMQQPAPQMQTRQQSQAPSSRPVETGTNAFSRVDKHEQDAIVFSGSEKDVARLGTLLAQLDKRAGELVVKAVVYEVRNDSSEGSALKLAASIVNAKVGFTGSLDSNALKISVGGFEAIYSALSGDNRFKLVSSPTMRVVSGGSARFVAGSEVPVLGNVTYPNNSQPVQSVEYKPAGVILDVKPQIREAVTDLTISQQISSFVQTTTGVNQSPTLLKRELQTEISVVDGDVIVLGGLEENRDTSENTGLSFLPEWLRSSASGKQRTEILVVLDARRI